MSKVERQVATTLKGIRSDHVERYKLASRKIRLSDKVLDIACGVGYGSFLIARQARPLQITALDRSVSAINTAKKYYNHPKIGYLRKNVFDVGKKVERNSIDVIVSFETLEHINEDKLYLRILYTLLKTSGKLILSTPNGDVVPYDKECFSFHARHYRTCDFINILEKTGFFIREAYSQVDNIIVKGFGGKFNIAVCGKKKTKTKRKKNMIKKYVSLLKENCCRDFSRQFIKKEAVRLVTIKKKEEFLYLVKQWLEFEKVHPLYLKGFFYEKEGQKDKALKFFRKASCSKLTKKTKPFAISSFYHLARLYRDKNDKIRALTDCLKLSPGHRKAKQLLKELDI